MKTPAISASPAIAGERLSGFGDRVLLVRTRYDGIEGVLAETDYWASKVDGILFDLGVSSMQLDRTERGFSYASDAPLDMRMDPDAPLTAADVVNTYDERTLARLLREFGEERFAGRIAAKIVRRRANRPFSGTASSRMLHSPSPSVAIWVTSCRNRVRKRTLRCTVEGPISASRVMPFRQKMSHRSIVRGAWT